MELRMQRPHGGLVDTNYPHLGVSAARLQQFSPVDASDAGTADGNREEGVASPCHLRFDVKLLFSLLIPKSGDPSPWKEKKNHNKNDNKTRVDQDLLNMKSCAVGCGSGPLGAFEDRIRGCSQGRSGDNAPRARGKNHEEHRNERGKRER